MSRPLCLPGSREEARWAALTVAGLAVRANAPAEDVATVLAALGLDAAPVPLVRGALASGTAWRSGNRR